MRLRSILAGEIAALGGSRLDPFDVHAHTGADVDGTTRTCEEHVAAIEALDGRSVIFPLCVTSGYPVENRRVIAECDRHPDRLVPFARLDPRESAVGADAADALADGARGFKLHPRSEDFRLDHSGVDAIAGVAAEARAPVLIHAGLGVGSFGETIIELSSRHPRCPIILAHAAISDLNWLWRAIPEHPNLFFDTSWWNAADLLALYTRVPPGRILFGSDAPYMDLDLIFAINLRCARFAGLSGEAIELIAGRQLETLLAGELPHDAGPAPGSAEQPSPAANRVTLPLAAAGGAMLSGGDPSQMLEMARLAAGADGSAISAGGPLFAELLAEIKSGTPEAPWAVAMALATLATPGIESAAPAA